MISASVAATCGQIRRTVKVKRLVSTCRVMAEQVAQLSSPSLFLQVISSSHPIVMYKGSHFHRNSLGQTGTSCDVANPDGDWDYLTHLLRYLLAHHFYTRPYACAFASNKTIYFSAPTPDRSTAD